MIDKEYYLNKSDYTYEDLLKIVKDLRQPDGCPWDRAQTHESLNECMIEECYEAVSAVRQNDMENYREELGDVLLQVILNSEIADEEGAFSIDDVVKELCEKLVRRHPHVFGDAMAVDPEQSLKNWESIKKNEKKSASEENKNELERIPEALPALMRAQKVVKKAEKHGYSAYSAEEAADRIRENLDKLMVCTKGGESAQKSDFSGALLLETVVLLAKMGINAENALTIAIEQYITNFVDSL